MSISMTRKDAVGVLLLAVILSSLVVGMIGFILLLAHSQKEYRKDPESQLRYSFIRDCAEARPLADCQVDAVLLYPKLGRRAD